MIETPTQMFQRVALAVARADAGYGASEREIAETARRFYRLMASGLFLPNSPTLMNAGRQQGLLSACFVLPIEDSVEEIFDSVACTARIQKAGGGTGFSFDRLRPTGDLVASSGGKTSGPISFWRVFAQTTEAIQQGAHRRGANMGMMSVEHPDILKFIHAKQDRSAFCNFNISVKIPDSFMTALREHPDEPHVVVNPRSGCAHADSQDRRCRELRGPGSVAGRSASRPMLHAPRNLEHDRGQRPRHRRARHLLHRSRQRVQPHTSIGSNRGDEPLWRTAAPAL